MRIPPPSLLLKTPIFKGNHTVVFDINTEKKTIDCYQGYVEASLATGFAKTTIRDCVKLNRHPKNGAEHVFMTNLNIKKDEKGNLVYDEEEIRQAVITRMKLIEDREKIAKENTFIPTEQKPVVIMNIKTKKARKFPNQGEAAKALGISKHYLRARITAKGYYIIDNESILIPTQQVVDKNEKLDKKKYSKYLEILQKEGYKEPTTMKRILGKYVNIDRVNESIKGIYIIDKNAQTRRFSNINSVCSFLNREESEVNGCIEQEKYSLKGFVILPAYFVESLDKKAPLDKELLEKIASISKKFADKEL